MNQKKKKQLTYWLSVAIIGIALGFGLQFVRAWTEPTTAPPNGNVGAPINTGANVQEKGDATHNGDICVWNGGVKKCLSAAGSSGGGTCTCYYYSYFEGPGKSCVHYINRDCGGGAVRLTWYQNYFGWTNDWCNEYGSFSFPCNPS